METPNGNSQKSILPGLPSLKHRDVIILFYRKGVDPEMLGQLASTHLYPVDEGTVRSHSIYNNIYKGTHPALAPTLVSMSAFQRGEESDPSSQLPPPVIGLYIMPYQESRLQTFPTDLTYVVTATHNHLIFEKVGEVLDPKFLPLPGITSITTSCDPVIQIDVNGTRCHSGRTSVAAAIASMLRERWPGVELEFNSLDNDHLRAMARLDELVNDIPAVKFVINDLCSKDFKTITTTAAEAHSHKTVFPGA